MNIAVIFAGGVGSRMHSKDRPTLHRSHEAKRRQRRSSV